MGINFKYYIISIASIFIALGIGIFIGFNMNGEDLYLKQQEALINSLENQFNEFKVEKENLQQQIKTLNEEKEKLSSYIDSTYEEIIENRLPEAIVGIIETTDHYYYENIEETLATAGAYVPFRVVYSNELIDLSEEKMRNLEEIIGQKINNTQEAMSIINQSIVDYLIANEENDVVTFLLEQKLVTIDLKSGNTEKVDHIVIAGGNTEQENSKVEQIDVDLINKLKTNHLRVIGVERSDVVFSYIPAYRKLDITTVDNVDTVIGQVSLVYTLKGEQGHFGEKDTADSLVPSNFSVLNEE